MEWKSAVKILFILRAVIVITIIAKSLRGKGGRLGQKTERLHGEILILNLAAINDNQAMGQRMDEIS